MSAKPATKSPATAPAVKPATLQPVVPARKGRAAVDPNETKEQKLLRLGNARVKAALTRIRLIGNLAAYRPSAAQIDHIEETLGIACATVVQRLRGTTKESFTFSLHQ